MIDTGKRIRRSRPRSEWLEYRDESLRIVSDELFGKAQERSQELSNPDGRLKRGLDNDPRAAAKARVILRDLLGPIQMCPGKDGSLWAQYHTRPAALIKRAVGANVELSGSGGVICAIPTAPGLVRLK